MTDLTVLLDMDDVLENFCAAWCEALNREYGTNVHEDVIKSWYLEPYFPSLTRQQLYAPTNTPEFWESVQPAEGAQECVDKLLSMDVRVRVVTAAYPITVPWKMQWIEKHLPNISWRDVVIASDKSIIQGDVLVDDAEHNLMNFPAARVLFSRPHNRNVNCDALGAYRARDWNDVYNHILYLMDAKACTERG